MNEGLRKHRLYEVWHGMKQRCQNENDDAYKFYGGRGIKVCERWQNSRNFIADMFPTFQEGLQLDRIDTNGNYESANCRWATISVQMKNRRNKCDKQSEVDNVTYKKSHDKWLVTYYFKTKEEAEGFAQQVKDVT